MNTELDAMLQCAMLLERHRKGRIAGLALLNNIYNFERQPHRYIQMNRAVSDSDTKIGFIEFVRLVAPLVFVVHDIKACCGWRQALSLTAPPG